MFIMIDTVLDEAIALQGNDGVSLTSDVGINVGINNKAEALRENLLN